MKNRQEINPGYSQLRWLILLLAIAVILPTVCLLWFMTQAVKNERLAIKEKLMSVYENRIEMSIKEELKNKWVHLHLNRHGAEGYLVFDPEGNLSFPVVDVDDAFGDDLFNLGYNLEYVQNNLSDALNEYIKISGTAETDRIRIKADIAQARCLRKLNNIDGAINKLKHIVSEYPENELFLRAQKCRAHLFLLETFPKTDNEAFKKILSDTYDYAVRGMAQEDDFMYLGEKSHSNKYIPSALQVLVLERFIGYKDLVVDESISKKVKWANRLIPKIKMSLQMFQLYDNPSFLDKPENNNGPISRLDTQEQLYIYRTLLRDHRCIHFYTRSYIAHIFEPFLKDLHQLPSKCSIYDQKGDFVTGAKFSNRKPFITKKLYLDQNLSQDDWVDNTTFLPNWMVELYIDDSAFENAANKQTAIYTWTAVLVIVLILVAGGFAGRAVGRQIRLNKLKNNFIATISHELKTPLSSMRVLVDTLLEGSYKDQQTATEYLGLISKENMRLSRLIDNFLTFSRMERDKRAFDIVRTSPVTIARDASEAVQTEFNKGKCKFEVDIAENLPDISADHDAMVTVLVNLLDNAYKYSDEDKHIQLKVFAQDGHICFSVKDNGTGMSSRAIKKVFNRFYQVDRSLTRSAEGCGLGLSIVKFIVDAHKGSIVIDSKPGKGSTFTVKLSAARNGRQ